MTKRKQEKRYWYTEKIKSPYFLAETYITFVLSLVNFRLSYKTIQLSKYLAF